MYYVGDTTHLSNHVQAVGDDGVAADADPASMSLVLISPSGARTQIDIGSMTRDSTGHYHVVWTWSEAGYWRSQWTSSDGTDTDVGDITTWQVEAAL